MSDRSTTRDPVIRELISAAEIQRRCAEMGAEITRDYAGKDLVLVGVLKGSFLFVADLCRHIRTRLACDFLGVASYGDETTSSGVVRITSDLTLPIEGKHVLVVEDIVDTGLTADYLLEFLRGKRPASVRLCSLLHKPERMEKAVAIDYVGFRVPNEFVVGYGLDFTQYYRNLPFIGRVEDPAPAEGAARGAAGG